MSGSSVHGISQARILEWVTISFSRVSSQPRDQTCVCLLHWQADSLPTGPFLPKDGNYYDYYSQHLYEHCYYTSEPILPSILSPHADNRP